MRNKRKKALSLEEGLCFEPWVGDKYKSDGIFYGKKLLILGESHYGYIDHDHEATRNTVCSYIKNESVGNNHWKSFFTKITKICTGIDQLDLDNKIEFWQSIIYYSYIQISLEKSRDRPKEEKWKYPNNEKRFKEMLKKYSPDYLLVCGKQLWEHLPGLDGFDENKPFDYSWYYNGGRTLSTFIYHPSSFSCYGTKKRRSREIFQQLINETRHLTK